MNQYSIQVLKIVILLFILMSQGIYEAKAQDYRIDHEVEIEGELIIVSYVDVYLDDLNRIEIQKRFYLIDGTIDSYEAQAEKYNTYNGTTKDVSLVIKNTNFAFDTDPDNTPVWNTVYELTAEYDASGNLILEESYENIYEDGVFTESRGIEKVAQSFDTDGEQLSRVIYDWDYVIEDWYPVDGWEFQVTKGSYDTTRVSLSIVNNIMTSKESLYVNYDQLGHLLTREEYVFESEIRTNVYKKDFTYTGEVIETEITYQGEGQIWNNERKVTYSYDIEGNLSEYAEFIGSDATDDGWLEIARNTFVTTSISLDEEYKIYDYQSLGLYGVRKSYSEFTSENQPLVIIEYGEKIGLKDDQDLWENISKRTYDYGLSSENKYVVMNYGVNYLSGTFQEQREITYSYSGTLDVYDEDNTVVKLRVKEYKGSNGEWKTVFDNTNEL